MLITSFPFSASFISLRSSSRKLHKLDTRWDEFTSACNNAFQRLEIRVYFILYPFHSRSLRDTWKLLENHWSTIFASFPVSMERSVDFSRHGARVKVSRRARYLQRARKRGRATTRPVRSSEPLQRALGKSLRLHVTQIMRQKCGTCCQRGNISYLRMHACNGS